MKNLQKCDFFSFSKGIKIKLWIFIETIYLIIKLMTLIKYLEFHFYYDMSGEDQINVAVNLQELRLLPRWFTVIQCGGKQVSPLEENNVCKHVRTSMLKSVSERGGLCVKIG